MEQKWNRIKCMIAAVGLLLLIFNSGLVLESAKIGIDLCLKTVIPSLFPFFVLSMFLVDTLKGTAKKPLHFLLQRFGIPESAGAVLVPALLGGYPVGAKTVGDLFRRKQIDRKQAEWLISFCNNAGPSFIFGMVSGFFLDRKYIWLLWFVQLFSATVTAVVMPIKIGNQDLSEARSEMHPILLSAAKAMCLVCCWVILFRVIISFFYVYILRFLPFWLQVIVTGILELTNGCFALLLIDDMKLRFVLCACMLSFGGLCVLFQTASVTKGLSIKSYIKGKIIQTLFSLLLSCAIIMEQGIFAVVFMLVFAIFLRKNQNRYRNPEILPV